ncbi:hypothetical protein Pyn_18811 [Prunus yedoensis var. nudiflora]|uniref:Uncharacterized protein n=1 Tax=Prunus yedoensis var. nudiflora TaxID=2094558 RepID=A0A314ZSP3_PRUYE|nr:hypothetical protein Pyn_18811 [Prunus yedoensis var. nudiflora]
MQHVYSLRVFNGLNLLHYQNVTMWPGAYGAANRNGAVNWYNLLPRNKLTIGKASPIQKAMAIPFESLLSACKQNLSTLKNMLKEKLLQEIEERKLQTLITP